MGISMVMVTGEPFAPSGMPSFGAAENERLCMGTSPLLQGQHPQRHPTEKRPVGVVDVGRNGLGLDNKLIILLDESHTE
jgi:hypothetical protein